MSGSKLYAGRYMLREIAGFGGMSKVYEAEDIRRRNATVAVKIVQVNSKTDKNELEREAKALEKLKHEHIIRLLDYGYVNNEYYTVTEFIPGYTLKEYIKQRGHLGKREAVGIALVLLDALQYSHAHKIVHGDVKPLNVLMSRDGTIKLADFGLARNLEKTQNYKHGELTASAHYVAPELINNEQPTPVSDLYAVAVTLYEMLTGRVPFEGKSFESIMYMHLHNRPTPPHELEPSVSKGLEEVILKGMAKNKTLRYQSASEMRSDLVKVLQHPAGGFVDLTGLQNADEVVIPRPVRNWQRYGVIASVSVALITLAVVMALVIMRASSVAQVRVPYVVNLPESEAVALLAETGLASTSVEMYHDEIPSGYVIRQSPEGGESVSQNSSVLLTVSRGIDMVMVPVLTGHTRAEAVRMLDESSIPVTREEVVLSSQPAGTVVGQTPEAGNWISPSDGVALQISGVSVSVPNVVDETLEQATADMEAAGLRIVARVYYPSGDGVSGTVMSSYPAAGTEVLRGSDVTLTVYTTPPTIYSAVVDVVFSVVTDAPTASVRAVLIDQYGVESEEYRDDSPPTDSMKLNLTLEKATPGAYRFVVYVDESIVVDETVVFE